MKTKWIVSLHFQVGAAIEADEFGAAAAKAARLANDRAKQLGLDQGDAHIVKQVGEPWASSSGWYDLHSTSDVIVVRRAYGNRFSRRDITLLRRRLKRIGLKVVDSWNGLDCDTVSFRCKGRKGRRAMSKKHLRELLAPRKEG